MKTKKTDRRVKYTKMVIKDSYIKLLKQKPVSKITIKRICEDADSKRATFYNHYLDQYDLLHQIKKEVIDDISQYLNNYDENLKEVPTEMIVKFLKYIKGEAELFNHRQGD